MEMKSDSDNCACSIWSKPSRETSTRHRLSACFVSDSTCALADISGANWPSDFLFLIGETLSSFLLDSSAPKLKFDVPGDVGLCPSKFEISDMDMRGGGGRFLTCFVSCSIELLVSSLIGIIPFFRSITVSNSNV